MKMSPLHKYLSHAAGLLAGARVRWLKNLLIRLFVWRYKPNMAEAIHSQPSDYQSFKDFFIRELKPGARPIAESSVKNSIVSPADGKLVAFAKLDKQKVITDLGSGGEADEGDDQQIQNIKGQTYPVSQLLGLSDAKPEEHQLLSRFAGGSYALIYLAPHNYHRVHFPCDAELMLANFIPGSLFPVNDASVATRPSLHAYNQRLACICETEHGLMGYVMVAALIVSSIGTCFAPEHRALSPARTLRPKRKFAKGDELGYFNLGSSVVLLWEKPGMVPLVPKGDELQVGQLLYKAS